MRLSHAREQAILAYRERTLEGPHRIVWALGEAPATVHRVLRRFGAPRLRDLDRPTRTVVRYERERPGELVHVDVKKLGRIPVGGGWRVHGRANVPGSKRHRGDGYDFVHAAVDDRSRLAYAEILPDERKETAAGFIARAIGFYAERGVSIERVLTDNGACYRSRPFARLLADAGIGHVRTRPYRPQTNGKGGAVQPDPEVGVGLRPALRDERLTRRPARALAPSLQLPSTAHGTRRQGSEHGREQRPEEAQLVTLVRPPFIRSAETVTHCRCESAGGESCPHGSTAPSRSSRS
jgi:transposase InsO family protein